MPSRPGWRLPSSVSGRSMLSRVAAQARNHCKMRTQAQARAPLDAGLRVVCVSYGSASPRAPYAGAQTARPRQARRAAAPQRGGEESPQRASRLTVSRSCCCNLPYLLFGMRFISERASADLTGSALA